MVLHELVIESFILVELFVSPEIQIVPLDKTQFAAELLDFLILLLLVCHDSRQEVELATDRGDRG